MDIYNEVKRLNYQVIIVLSHLKKYIIWYFENKKLNYTFKAQLLQINAFTDATVINGELLFLNLAC